MLMYTWRVYRYMYEKFFWFMWKYWWCWRSLLEYLEHATGELTIFNFNGIVEGNISHVSSSANSTLFERQYCVFFNWNFPLMIGYHYQCPPTTEQPVSFVVVAFLFSLLVSRTLKLYHNGPVKSYKCDRVRGRESAREMVYKNSRYLSSSRRYFPVKITSIKGKTYEILRTRKG